MAGMHDQLAGDGVISMSACLLMSCGERVSRLVLTVYMMWVYLAHTSTPTPLGRFGIRRLGPRWNCLMMRARMRNLFSSPDPTPGVLCSSTIASLLLLSLFFKGAATLGGSKVSLFQAQPAWWFNVGDSCRTQCFPSWYELKVGPSSRLWS
jgi:hypothetical protein